MGATDTSFCSPRPLHLRLKALEDWHQRWKRMQWSEKHQLTSYDGSTLLVHISGPVYAREVSKSRPHVALEFIGLSSPSRGVKPTRWTLPGLCDHDAFTFDHYQDLLVLIEKYVLMF